MTAARNALTLGRPVMAVPGPITSDLSAGCNTLIRQGRATAVTSASEVIETITAAGSATTG
jgi:DNA processing protein